VKGHEYRDRIAAYLVHNYGNDGVEVYTEVPLGKTIIGKDRKVDVFLLRRHDGVALAIECKYQDVPGTTDEKIPYALSDLDALRVGACLSYAGEGWSRGILHMLEASSRAAFCLPSAPSYQRTPDTLQLDYIVAATFSLWKHVIPERRRFRAQ